MNLNEIFDLPVTVGNVSGLWTQFGFMRFDEDSEKRNAFIKLLLDAGVTVRGYWKNQTYEAIDPRIQQGFNV